MKLVYFESLNSDGSLSPHIISSYGIALVRSLNCQELDLAERLSSGRSREFGIFFEAAVGTIDAIDSFHPAAQSALHTFGCSEGPPEQTYYLVETVQQLATRLNGIVASTSDPNIAVSADTSDPGQSAGADDQGPDRPTKVEVLGWRFRDVPGPRWRWHQKPAPR